MLIYISLNCVAQIVVHVLPIYACYFQSNTTPYTPTIYLPSSRYPTQPLDQTLKTNSPLSLPSPPPLPLFPVPPTMSSLSGVQITTGPTTWTIGPLIGSGACSLGVFSITPSVPSSKPTKKQKSSQSNLRWCVKFAEVVETKGKKKKTDKQRNSDQIFYEYQLYSNALGERVD